MNELLWVGVFVGGGLGALARFGVDGAVSQRVPGVLPVGTLVVNLSGALVLGVLSGLVLPPAVALVCGTGVVGSYTTFSTWMFETQRLLEEHRATIAWANLVVSTVAGLGLAAVGVGIGGLSR